MIRILRITMEKSKHPEWAIKYRLPGTELRLMNGNYYLYEYKTIYDSVSKKPKKVTGKYLGRIFEDKGLVAKRELLQPIDNKLSVGSILEWGVSNYILKNMNIHLEHLQSYFPAHWQLIVGLAYCRLCFQSPIKRMPHYISHSWLFKNWQLNNIGAINDKKISILLNEIGKNREAVVGFFKCFVKEGDFVLADTSHILSNSNKISLAQKGYNSTMNFEPQINLMYLYSSTNRMPIYYRLNAGNIRDVKSFKLSLAESGITDAIIIMDKGFYSKKNETLLDSQNLRYILPIRRNSSLIDYKPISSNNIKKEKSYFQHEDRFIWFIEQKLPNNKRCILYLDEYLKGKEERDYLKRIENKQPKYKIENFQYQMPKFGTFALLTQIQEMSAEKLYQAYKCRLSIEEMFDTLKNLLDCDSTYMQNEETLQGWMFINHIALQWYHTIYIDLAAKNLTSKYSVKDILSYLVDIKQVKINGLWHKNEITNSIQKIITKLNLN